LYLSALHAVTDLTASDKVAAAHRCQAAPINRITMLLVKSGETDAAVAAYNSWKSVAERRGIDKE
jgi:hypothetical protein